MPCIGEYKVFLHLNDIKEDDEGYELIDESGATSDVADMNETINEVIEVLNKAKEKGLITDHEIYFEDYHDA